MKNKDIENFKKYLYNQFKNPIKFGILNYAYSSIKQLNKEIILL